MKSKEERRDREAGRLSALMLVLESSRSCKKCVLTLDEVRTDPLNCPYRTIHLGVQDNPFRKVLREKSFRSTGEFAYPYREIRTKMVGRPLRGRRLPILAATAAVRPVSSCAFYFRHGAFCRRTGRGSVPAARFVVARATRTLPSHLFTFLSR